MERNNDEFQSETSSDRNQNAKKTEGSKEHLNDVYDKHESKLRPCFSVLISIILTGVVMIIGITIICLRAPKDTKQICNLRFESSMKADYDFDSYPYHIVVADVNKDDYMDILVVNSGSDNIGVFINYGNGSFKSQNTYSTGIGSIPRSIAVGDFNNDTILDIAVTNYGTNSLGILLGYHNGTFEDPLFISLGSSRPLSIVTGDINNDRVLDLAVVNYGTFTLMTLMGLNNGSFSLDNIYDMGYDSMPCSVAIDDINNDKRMDIIVVNYGTSELVLLVSNERGNFTIEKSSTGNHSHPSSVIVRNSNIIVANSGQMTLNTFSRNENGSLNRSRITLSNIQPKYLTTADFNHDNQFDLVVIDLENNKLAILQGSPTGEFEQMMTYSTGFNSGPSSIAIGDFDNDTKVDVVITNNRTNNILVLRGFEIYPVTDTDYFQTGDSSKPYSVDVADLNEDDYFDVVVPNSGTNNIGIFLNRGDGTFDDQIEYDMGENSRPFFVAAGDLNNDKHIDLVVVLFNYQEIQILLGYGNGTFEYGQWYASGSGTYTVAIGDFDADGNLDLITSNYYVGTVGIFFGYGDGTFTMMEELLDQFEFYPKCVGVGDFNNDKKIDIAVSNSENHGGIAILLGHGNRSFNNPLFTSTKGDLPNCFTIGDLNNDNHSDIVYTDTLYSHIGILLGIGNGTFNDVKQYQTSRGSKPWFVDIGYYNDDHFKDIVISNAYDSSISLLVGIGNGTFKNSDTFPTGFQSCPWSVKFADVDNDGQQDIVVANDVTNNILIFYVWYNATFRNETRYSTGSGSHPYSVDIADLNNDGQMDIVVANSGTDNIQLLFNYQNGTFIHRLKFFTEINSHSQSITIADFNKDQIFDIAVVNTWTSNINIFTGLENPYSYYKTVHSTGSQSFPSSIASADFNKDDRMDIVVANEGTNDLLIYLAFDYIAFTYDQIFVDGYLPTPQAVVADDFNNDHHIDIAVVNNYALNIDIYLGYGNGSFSQGISSYTGDDSSPVSLATGHFNNDTYLDIVVANSGTMQIGILLGYGNGSFQSLVPYRTDYTRKPTSVVTGDFNKDKILDIVITDGLADNICIFFGNGNGSFEGEIVYTMAEKSNPVWISTADLDSDGNFDLIFANFDADNICVLFGYGNGSFANELILSTGEDSGPVSIAIKDVNYDNLLDIIVANQYSKEIGIFSAYQNRTFSSQEAFSTGWNSNLVAISVTDINNDQLVDFIATDYNARNSSIAIWFGYPDGTSTFPNIYYIPSNSIPSIFTVNDLNNDGKLDIAVPYTNKHSIGILIQTNHVPFGPSDRYSTGNGSNPKSVVIGDFDNDNISDIAVANSNTNTIGLFFGYGTGDFSRQYTYSTGKNSQPISIAIGYLNSDTYLDIVVINKQTETIGILLNDQHGIFDNITFYSTGTNIVPSSIAVDDLNNDNFTDLIVTNWGRNDVQVLFGLGDGTFSTPRLYSVGYNARPQSVAIGDINNDTLLDIIVANYGTNNIDVLLQTC